MKRIKMMLVIIFSIMSFGIVQAKDDTLSFFKEFGIDITHVTDMVGYKEGYILNEASVDTNLYSYNDVMELKSTKKIEGLSNSKIIPYGDSFLIVGIQTNTLKVYLLDSNLKVLKQQETAYFIQGSNEINLYNYENKVYVMLTYDDNLIHTSIYEIDSELEVKENKFSSYNADILKNILKSDYYLVHNNDKEIDGKTIHYNSSTYLDGKNILVGNISNISYDDSLGFDEKGIVTFFDNKGDKINEVVVNNYLLFKDILIVKNKIVTLAKMVDGNYALVILNSDGELLEEINLNTIHDELKIRKLSNRVVVLDENRILNYSFLVDIYKEEDTFGSIEVPEIVNPYDLVKINVVPNSGYKVKEILVLDSQGNRIHVLNNEFVMPSNDVYITVNYEEFVTNPETLDIITIAIVILILGIVVCYRLYKKMIWLK